MPFHEVAGTSRDIAVARAVETVAADFVLVVQFAGQAVKIGGGWHRLVEGGVKDGDIWLARQHLYGFADAGQVGWIVEGRQLDIHFDGFEHSVVDNNRGSELFAPVHDSVPYRLDFINLFQNPVFGIDEGFRHACHGVPVVGDRFLDPDGAFGRALGKETTLFPDALHKAFSEAFAFRHAEDFVLER